MPIFKPNLIPNSKTDKPIILTECIDNLEDYIISVKKDGCRGELIDGMVKTRALKPCLSQWIQDRYKKMAEKCQELNIILEGEFYAHGWKFNEIVRVFKTDNVESEKHIKKFRTMAAKGKLETEWPGRSVDWLCSYHPEEFKFWPFDCFIADSPNAIYRDRLAFLLRAFNNGPLAEFKDLVCLDGFFNIRDITGIDSTYYERNSAVPITDFSTLNMVYETALDKGWEGLVLAKKSGIYKFGRSTAKAGEFYKMKDDKNEYDGKIIRVEESTVAAPWAEKTTNELGRSVTSKKQEDRLPSGMAKGFVCEYEGHEILVSFQGFDHEKLREIWENKEDFIDKWIIYTGMPPVKNVPRHAHFKCFRDEK